MNMYGKDSYRSFPKYSSFNYEPPRSYAEAAESLKEERMRYRWGIKEAKVSILFEFTNFLIIYFD